MRRRDLLAGIAATTVVGCVRTATRGAHAPSALQFRPLLTIALELGALQQLGAVPIGSRTAFPITGGMVTGARVRGIVLASGSDWTITDRAGVTELDLRATLQTDDGALIYVTATGVRDPATPIIRTTPRFETASPRYAFLDRLLAVGAGRARGTGVVHDIAELL